MLANTSAGLWHDMLENLLAKVVPGEAQALASNLVAGSGGVVSAEHGYRLLDLAAKAASDAEARALLGAEPLDPSAWQRLPATSPFRAELERFLDDFGHRGVYEVDIANPRWIEDPTYILRQVRLLLDSGVPTNFRDTGKRRRQEALRSVHRRASMLLPLVRWLARRASNAAALREGRTPPSSPSSNRVGTSSSKWLGACTPPAYLTSVRTFSTSPWWSSTRTSAAGGTESGAKALVHDRKVQKEAWLADEPPDVIMESGSESQKSLGAAQGIPHVSAQGALQVTSEESAQTLRGTGVAAGTATGRVRILRHPSEGERLGAGEIPWLPRPILVGHRFLCGPPP